MAAHTSIPSLDLTFGNSDHTLFVLKGDSITSLQQFPDGSIMQLYSVGGLPASATGLAAN